MAWEEVEVPRGAYVGWGDRKGQHVTGKVCSYEDGGATDFNGNPCPHVEIELTDRAASFNKKGERQDYEPGEMVCLSAGQVSLKRAVKKANLAPGVLTKITLSDLVETSNGTVKEFGIAVDRSQVSEFDSGPTQAAQPAASAPVDDDEPPF